MDTGARGEVFSAARCATGWFRVVAYKDGMVALVLDK
jgi:hypothetical protein